MKIYVINLKRAVGRMAKIDNSMKSLGIEYERIEAIDGNNFEINESCIDQYRFKIQQKRRCTLGEVGCAESHRKVWREILKHNFNSALILEDDVILPHNLGEILSSLETKTQLDIINFSSTGNYPVNREKLDRLIDLGLKRKPTFKKNKIWQAIEVRNWKIYQLHSVDELILCECSMMPPLMSAYMVNIKACQALLRATTRLSYPVDYAYRHISSTIRQAFGYPVFIPQNPNLRSSIGLRDNKIELTLCEKILYVFIKQRPWINKLISR